ncbi:hypothetical protein chiPu_0016321 [Chiloscyllium punctatum]|uniref:Uncharacterized protein n=1 Tax=Chiloscyllium punctatum TaxID=137246 RepID=A0A401T5E4_CHIPU|nr:hypothetical protein [Chiloscyllium punctatum]
MTVVPELLLQWFLKYHVWFYVYYLIFIITGQYPGILCYCGPLLPSSYARCHRGSWLAKSSAITGLLALPEGVRGFILNHDSSWGGGSPIMLSACYSGYDQA